MEAPNKESEFAAAVLTWAQKRSDLREKSTVGKFVRSSLQGLNHEDVLLKLETKIIKQWQRSCTCEESLSALCFVKNYLCSMMMRLSLVLKHLI